MKCIRQGSAALVGARLSVCCNSSSHGGCRADTSPDVSLIVFSRCGGNPIDQGPKLTTQSCIRAKFLLGAMWLPRSTLETNITRHLSMCGECFHGSIRRGYREEQPGPARRPRSGYKLVGSAAPSTCFKPPCGCAPSCDRRPFGGRADRQTHGSARARGHRVVWARSRPRGRPAAHTFAR